MDVNLPAYPTLRRFHMGGSKDLVDSALRFLTDVTVVGTETVVARQAIHLRGFTDMGAKGAMFWPNWDNRTPEKRKGAEEPRAQFLAATEQVDVWIYPENNLLLIQKTPGPFPAM